MPYALIHYLRLVVRHLLLARPERTPVARVRRRFLLLFPLFELPTRFCLLLDHLLFPGHRRVPIREPLFIIGNPRSGTTLLHRLLSHDLDRFHCFRTWEIVFPSLLQQRLLSWLGRRDARRGGPLRRRIEAAEARRLKGFADVHQIGLFLPEEDGKLLIHALASPDLTWFFKRGDFSPFVRFDREVPPALQRHVLSFYAGCVRRHAYRHGRGKQLLSKNPFFTAKIRALRRFFPDCRFVCMLRNPLASIPSTISMARVMTGRPAQPDELLERPIYTRLKDYYLYALECLADLPPQRCACVVYDDLIRDPAATVRSLYERFGFDLGPAFVARVTAEAQAVRDRRSRHAYSLADMAITREEILSDLKLVFERFGFPTH